MDMILTYAAGALLVLLALKIFVKPIKWLIRLLFNTLLGGAALLLINTFGGAWGLHVAVNPLTAFLTGLLGLPGVVLLLIIQWIK